MNDFLPTDYKAPVTGGNYMKLQDGENTFRVLSSAIVGWVDWIVEEDGTRRPKRYRMAEKPQPFNPEQPVKHFWAFVVWNYDAQAIQILELTQKTIRDDIKALVDNKKWGDPKKYDITITRSGEKLETKYSVMPNPHSELPKEVAQLWEETSINLEALYDGGDPFGKEDIAAEVTF